MEIVRPDYSRRLMLLTKATLNRVRHNWDLAKMSQLNKVELASRLAELVPERAPEVLRYLNSEQHKLLRELIRNGGKIGYLNIQSNVALFYMERGLLVPTGDRAEDCYVMPPSILERLKPELDDTTLRGIIRKNDETIKVATGLLVYYGVLSISHFASLISSLVPKSDVTHLSRLLLAYGEYGGVFKVEGGHLFHLLEVADLHWLRAEIERGPKRYYPVTREMVTDAARFGIAERNLSYRRFCRQLITRFGLERIEAENITTECILAINNGVEVGRLNQWLTDELKVVPDDTNDQLTLNHLLMDLFNNTRRWALRGYTLTELSLAE